ncbi:basic proline-rich protein-like [Eublepharis macularius]|uniref:Basic proline-rich protein-like n=1 Tax=Eublepharis macularius TaxID=481883 RepID=A0AA97JFU0_EUBMA|nr:basic proline-rich protein-like [Eublepharis macularius]
MGCCAQHRAGVDRSGFQTHPTGAGLFLRDLVPYSLGSKRSRSWQGEAGKAGTGAGPLHSQECPHLPGGGWVEVWASGWGDSSPPPPPPRTGPACPGGGAGRAATFLGGGRAPPPPDQGCRPGPGAQEAPPRGGPGCRRGPPGPGRRLPPSSPRLPDLLRPLTLRRGAREGCPGSEGPPGRSLGSGEGCKGNRGRRSRGAAEAGWRRARPVRRFYGLRAGPRGRRRLRCSQCPGPTAGGAATPAVTAAEIRSLLRPGDGARFPRHARQSRVDPRAGSPPPRLRDARAGRSHVHFRSITRVRLKRTTRGEALGVGARKQASVPRARAAPAERSGHVQSASLGSSGHPPSGSFRAPEARQAGRRRRAAFEGAQPRPPRAAAPTLTGSGSRALRATGDRSLQAGRSPPPRPARPAASPAGLWLGARRPRPPKGAAGRAPQPPLEGAQEPPLLPVRPAAGAPAGPGQGRPGWRAAGPGRAGHLRLSPRLGPVCLPAAGAARPPAWFLAGRGSATRCPRGVLGAPPSLARSLPPSRARPLRGEGRAGPADGSPGRPCALRAPAGLGWAGLGWAERSERLPRDPAPPAAAAAAATGSPLRAPPLAGAVPPAAAAADREMQRPSRRRSSRPPPPACLPRGKPAEPRRERNFPPPLRKLCSAPPPGTLPPAAAAPSRAGCLARPQPPGRGGAGAPAGPAWRAGRGAPGVPGCLRA